jgi:hypothetical protein
MKLNAINMLKQAASTIENRRKDDGGYAWALEQLADHLADVRDGRHTWQEFAEGYCLTPSRQDSSIQKEMGS